MKNKTKKAAKSSKSRVKKYPAEFLAIILLLLLLGEGLLFSITTPADWLSSTEILNVSSGVEEVHQNLTTTLQPVFELVDGISQFYQLSATQMMQLLDLSSSGMGSEVGMIYDGVTEFYQQSGTQMAYLLDNSSLIKR